MRGSNGEGERARTPPPLSGDEALKTSEMPNVMASFSVS